MKRVFILLRYPATAERVVGGCKLKFGVSARNVASNAGVTKPYPCHTTFQAGVAEGGSRKWGLIIDGFIINYSRLRQQGFHIIIKVP